jgi:hypothetical protein
LPRSRLRKVGRRRPDANDQFARISKVLLVQLKAFYGGEVGRQEIENLDIKMQARQAKPDRNQQK